VDQATGFVSKCVNPRKALVALLGILLFAAAIRAACFSGFAGSDDGAYSEIANGIAKGEFKVSEYKVPPVFPLRLGLVLPLALLFKVSGPSEATVLLIPLTISLASIVLAFLAGRLIATPRSGLLAAALYALVPLDVLFATILTPDALVAFWINITALLLYVASRRESLRSRVGLGFLAGAAFIAAWLTKEVVVYAAPMAVGLGVLLTWDSRKYWVVMCSCGLTIVAGLVAESLYYFRETGDWLFRYHEIERNYALDAVNFFSEGGRLGWAPGHYWEAVLRRIFKDGPQAVFVNRVFGGVTLAALVAIGYGLLGRLRAVWYPAVWFLSLVLAFNFGSTSLKSYRPLAIAGGPSEYLYPVLLPATVLAAVLLDRLIPDRWPVVTEVNRERGFWGVCVAAGMLLSIMGSLYWIWAEGPESPVERVVHQRLSPSDRVFTDAKTARALRFFWKYPTEARLVLFEGMKREDIPKDVYVLINRRRMEHSRKVYGVVPPDFFDRPPEEWLRVWADHGGELYWVGRPS
jgi:hypothetical protein